MSGHAPWGSSKARRELAPRIQQTEFLIGQHPDLEKLRKVLLRTEERHDLEGLGSDSPMFFRIRDDDRYSLEPLRQIAEVFTMRSDLLGCLRMFAKSLEASAPPTMMLHKDDEVFAGFAVWRTQLQARNNLPAVRTRFLHAVTVDGWAWTVVRYPRTDPIVLLIKAEESEDEYTVALRDLVAITHRRMRENFDSPIVKALRAAGFGGGDKNDGA